MKIDKNALLLYCLAVVIVLFSIYAGYITGAKKHTIKLRSACDAANLHHLKVGYFREID